MTLEEKLRGQQIDNWAIDGDQVRIGSRLWRAERCACGSPRCDGWAFDRIDGPATRMKLH